MERDRGVYIRAALVGVVLGSTLGVTGLMVAAPALRGGSSAKSTARTAPPARAGSDGRGSETYKSTDKPSHVGNEETQTTPDGKGGVTTPTSPHSGPPIDPVSVDLAGIQVLIEQESRRIRGKVAIHLRIEGGGEAGINQDEAMPAASVIKLPLMAVVYQAWKDGFLQRTPVDEQRVRAMITRSENPSADGLIDRVGMSQVNNWLEEHGYSGTRLRHKMLGPRPEGPNLVTAAEMTRMLLQIERGELVNANASSEMRRLLLAQTRRTRIPAGVPDEAPVGNKTGTLNGIVNDVAFVEPPDGPRYAVAVLISGTGSDATASASIARLSRKVYQKVTHGTPEASGHSMSRQH
jgi:beta-lactamase class A